MGNDKMTSDDDVIILEEIQPLITLMKESKSKNHF